ncbi:hypothetical protein VKY48_29285 [Endobacterium cereale]|nr:hypothetical protein [Endobacterium cereale]
MKASNFSDTQNAFILKQGDDGVPVAEICRKAGVRTGMLPPVGCEMQQKIQPEGVYGTRLFKRSPGS